MENLFLQAIGTNEVEKINKIKKNKTFAHKLIGDLSQVFTVVVSNQDNQESTTYSLMKSSNYRPSFFFTANENGIIFTGKLLGYRKCTTKEWELGWIIDKYETCKGDANFMSDTNQPHGYVEIKLTFSDISANLNDVLRDITRILNREGFNKKF